MKAGGKTTKQTAKEDLFMQMEMSMMANGSTIRPMDLECIAILTELNTRDSGKRISNMETVSRHGQMVPSMRANMFKERKTARVDSLGLMAQLITEYSTKTISKEQANTTGPMAENITVSG